jgi:hypothetical protein
LIARHFFCTDHIPYIPPSHDRQFIVAKKFHRMLMQESATTMLELARALGFALCTKDGMGMRKIFIAMVASGSVAVFGTSSSVAAPASGEAILGSLPTSSLVEQVVWYHVRRSSRRIWVRGNLGRHACRVHYGASSRIRIHAGRC